MLSVFNEKSVNLSCQKLKMICTCVAVAQFYDETKGLTFYDTQHWQYFSEKWNQLFYTNIVHSAVLRDICNTAS